MNAYNFITLVEDQGWIYILIEKGMYGLKQAGIIANQELVNHLAQFGYNPVQKKLGLWVHDNRHTIFSLVVEGICVQYSSTEDANFFLNALRAKYLIIVNMEATFYIGIKLVWDYVNITITLLI